MYFYAPTERIIYIRERKLFIILLTRTLFLEQF